jgi:hypothetical protein
LEKLRRAPLDENAIDPNISILRLNFKENRFPQ